MWRTKRILIPITFFGSFCLSNWFLYLLVGLLIGCLVDCLVICFLWLVGRSVLVGWLVDFSSFWCWLTARLTAPWSFHSLHGFTEHKSSADHSGWHPGCKWTSQIWNVAHCLEALGCNQCTYTYDISQLFRKATCFHSWIDKLLIFSVILVWQLVEKNSINFCPGVYTLVLK